MHEWNYLTYVLAFAVTLAATVVLFQFLWRGASTTRRLMMRLSLAGLTLFVVFLGAEAWFRFVQLESSGYAMTLSSQRWFKKYWKPVNSLGYRDIEPFVPPSQPGKLLVVLGDSFVAGHGVADPERRFSNHLRRALAPDWTVANVARCGWSTKDELQALQEFPYRADAVVLSYFINDIDRAARLHGREFKRKLPTPHWRIVRITEASYFLDFLHRRWRAWQFAELGDVYWHHLIDSYADDAIWTTHADELMRVVDYCRSHDIQLSVVVFPHLLNAEESRPITAKVVKLLQAASVPTVDLTDEFARSNPRRMVVNAFDGHPNEVAHALVAERLLPLLRRGHTAALDAQSTPMPPLFVEMSSNP